ncbi:MAG: tRNA (N6-isopentenyl adenosine(37)-C2)-methylthiotransferase MiaB [Planctomycetota bacterium]|jgi:tRNA-2-methylthio-N6-dimethylallyladenosine synthase
MNNRATTVCIVTFGCQMNKLDSELLRGELVRSGFALSDEPERADIVLYNTCSVRQHAEDRALSHLGSYRRRARGEGRFVLGVIGCMAQRLGARLLEQFDHLDLVCGTRAFLRVPEYLRHVLAGRGPIVDVEEDGALQFDRQPTARVSPHRAYVSVMRGCDTFCSYCIVPYVRGREVSRAPEEIVAEVRALSEDGVREVTLLGQNVNAYGRRPRRDGATLADLLARVNEVDGLERVRFVTSHPRDVSDALLDAVAGLAKVCEHLHVPAQSGSDAVLLRMGRGYTAEEYRRMVERARARIPGVAIASDFMVGFPGETEADFRDTLGVVQEVGFQQSFIFKYSPRPGTWAACWPDDVPDEAKRERNRRLLEAQEQVDAARRAAMVGQVVEVLVDGPSKADAAKLSGRTRGNDIVVFSGAHGLSGRLQEVRITDSTALTLFGEPAS